MLIISISVFNVLGSSKVEVDPNNIDEILKRLDDVKAVIVSKYENFNKTRRKYIRNSNTFKVLSEDDEEIGKVPTETMKKWLKTVLNSIKNGDFLDISFIS